MMHQIRKMIGLALAVVRGFATEDHVKRSMEQPYMDVPKAPGLGLMLEEAHFDRYNRKYGGDGHHETLTWDSCNAKVEEFKNKYIYPVVVETERQDKSMLKWLHTLSLHTYSNELETKVATISKEDVEEHSTEFGSVKKIKLSQENEEPPAEVSSVLVESQAT